jgi:Zn-dependent protease with chaperone function
VETSHAVRQHPHVRLAIVFGVAAVFLAQNWLEGQTTLASLAPEIAGRRCR